METHSGFDSLTLCHLLLEAWMNAGTLVTRMNFGLDLALGRIRGIRIDNDQTLFPGWTGVRFPLIG